MIRIENINKSFGELQVLKDVSLQVPDAKIVTILGPSGAGKTTLLQIMSTLDKADSGSITYVLPDGSEVRVDALNESRMSRFRNCNVGFVFQFHELLPEFSALENVMLPALIAGSPRAAASSRAAELLRKLRLGDREKHRPAELSGGEKQRVAVARALMNKPGVVFADEPTGSLDSRNGEEIRTLFTTLCREMGQTFVIATHDRLFEQISDMIVRMEDGRIVAVEEM